MSRRRTKFDVSDHYRGERGSEYFARQNQKGDIGGLLSSRWYSDYVSPTDRVLDFGCGGGWLLKHLNCAVRVGVEPNLAAHRQCRANGVAAYASLGDVQGAYDVVVSNHCLEHVPYPIEALTHLKKFMKRSGKLVVMVPIDDWRVQRDRGDAADPDHHLHTWTPRLISNTLSESGFVTQRVRVITSAWPPGYQQFACWLPRAAFDALCVGFSILAKRRQLFALATPDQL